MEGEGACIREIHGSWEEAYSLLPFCITHLLNVNPKALACLVREADVSFQRLFRAFGHCVRGYRDHLRRIL